MNPYSESDINIEYKLLLEAIFLKFNYDFRQYSVPSLKKRILQSLTPLNVRTLSGLQKKVIHEPKAFAELLQFLTIPSSEMFRDPAYFLALRTKVFPHLSTYPFIKIWIPGCSTGEEAYSMAILLKEEGLLERSMIYATDINLQSLELALSGVFNLSQAEKFAENYKRSGGLQDFSDYYTTTPNGMIFDEVLKKNIIFSDHSLATDSVFAETHLISCRNVLIYFNRELQDRALGLFYDSLCRKCFLGLGGKETIRFSKYSEVLPPFASEERIFQKI